ncbi:MAG: penicillin-binding protein 2 [Actinobacteria bacterium]|nr:penicillin-binding protein 2 [Actinomycetota bacterium]
MTRNGHDLDDFFGRPGPGRLVAVPDESASRSGGVRTASRPATRPASRSTSRSTSRPTSRSTTRPAGRSTGRPAPRPAPRPDRPPARPARAPRPPRPPVPPVDGATAMRRTRRRLIGFIVVVVLLLVAVTAKLVDVQATQRSFWIERGEQARDASRTIPADRGDIYDRNGRLLAVSVDRPNVVADPSQITDPAVRERVATKLATLLGVAHDDLLARLSRGDTHYQVLAPTVDGDTEAAVTKAIEAGDLPSIALEPTYDREYPSGDVARSLVGRTYDHGRVDEEGRQGRYGLELTLDDQLTGTPGLVRFEQDVDGNPIAGTPERTEAAVPGNDVHLTVDASLQYATQQALARQVEATGAAEAMAVITRPSTGEVLAMASVAKGDDGTIAPTVDNRAATTVFEPGSVNKIITVAGAIEDGVVDPDSLVEVPDNLTLYDHTFTDHDPHPTRIWSTTDILVTSSNIGTIKIAQRLGAERVDHYLRSFGLGQRTGDQIPGEVNGLMLDLDQWAGTSIGAIPIGQGISVTAIQMLTAFNAIANDGVVVPPRVIASVDRGSGEVTQPGGDARRVLSPETAAETREILAKVVSEGTGQKAAVPGYTAFGKTGTPRIPQTDPTDPKDAYRNAQGGYDYQPVFLGGIEGADLSIIVTVRQPKTSIYGGDVAAPLFSELAVLALRTLDVAPPSLAGPVETRVPDLSSTAREVDGEGPASAGAGAQG